MNFASQSEIIENEFLVGCVGNSSNFEHKNKYESEVESLGREIKNQDQKIVEYLFKLNESLKKNISLQKELVQFKSLNKCLEEENKSLLSQNQSLK